MQQIQHLDKERNEFKRRCEQLERDMQHHQSASHRMRDEYKKQVDDLEKEMKANHEEHSLGGAVARKDKMQKVRTFGLCRDD